MACIGKRKTASGIRRYIQLSPGENESRPKISLGKVTKKHAETAKRNIESLIQFRNTGDVLSPAVQEWLCGIADGLRKRLNILGIAAQDKDQSFTVAEWVRRYIERRPDVKQSTRKKWRDAEGKLSAFFRGQYINEITVQLSKDYRVYLRSTIGLAENSIRRHIGIARQFFNSAIDAKIIEDNPFCGKQQPVSVLANESKFYYVTQEMALKVLEACLQIANGG